MTEQEMLTNLRVVKGYAYSLSEQIDGLKTFLNEVAAMTEYSERGIIDLKLRPIFIEMNNMLQSIRNGNNIIIDSTKDVPDAEMPTQE